MKEKEWKEKYREYKESGGKMSFSKFKEAISSHLSYLKSKECEQQMGIVKKVLGHKN